jgi:hypothetical protein
MNRRGEDQQAEAPAGGGKQDQVEKPAPPASAALVGIAEVDSVSALHGPGF